MFFCVWLLQGRCSHEFSSSYVLRLFPKVQGALRKKRVTKKYVLYIFGMKVARRTSVSCFLCIVFSCTVDTGRTLKEKGKFQAILEQIVLLGQHGNHSIICSVVSTVGCAVFFGEHIFVSQATRTRAMWW